VLVTLACLSIISVCFRFRFLSNNSIVIMAYQHPSGSQKRQKKKELMEKEKESMSKVPRISSFFHKEPFTLVVGGH